MGSDSRGSSKGSSKGSKDEGESGGLLASLFGGSSKAKQQQAGGRAANSLAPASIAEEEKWRRWVDDWFVKVGGGCGCVICGASRGLFAVGFAG